MRIKAILLPLAASTLLLAACNSQLETIPDRADSADQEVTNAHVVRSENGRKQLELDAKLIQKYERPRAMTQYRSRDGVPVKMRFFDANDGHVTVTITADSAVSFDDRNIMEAHGNVVVIDFKNGDTVYLEDLIWNDNEDRVYSDHPVRARNGKRLTEGDAFTSDSRMEHMQIVRQRGVVEFKDD